MCQWACFNCHTVQYEDELGTQTEMMDQFVPGSYQTWTVCGKCGSDEIAELDPPEIFGFLHELVGTARHHKLERLAMDLELLGEMVEAYYG
jgi:hypothetical protein